MLGHLLRRSPAQRRRGRPTRPTETYTARQSETTTVRPVPRPICWGDVLRRHLQHGRRRAVLLCRRLLQHEDRLSVAVLYGYAARRRRGAAGTTRSGRMITSSQRGQDHRRDRGTTRLLSKPLPVPLS